MIQFRTSRTISAPIDRVFAALSDPSQFSEAVPHILNIEFLSDVKSGVGTKFRETRLMGKKEATTELEITECVENEHIRIVTESNGTLWDTVMSVSDSGGKTELNMAMDATASGFFGSLMIKMIKGMIQKALEKDMDCLKEYCEKPAES